MKKTAPWDSTFSDKLAQSQDAKNARLKKIAGYSLYRLHKSIIEETLISSFYYKINLGNVYGVVTILNETRWLKPKHVTLLRMKGITVSPLRDGRRSNCEKKVGYNLDIKID